MSAPRRPAAGGPTRATTRERPRPRAAAPKLPEPPGRSPRRRSRLTGRAALLLIVVATLLVSLAWPVRQYVDHRRDIAELQARTAAVADRVAELEAEKDRWSDPAYVKAQARERLHFIMPGERSYIVLTPGARQGPATAPVSTGPPPAWYAQLWDSVERASGPP